MRQNAKVISDEVGSSSVARKKNKQTDVIEKVCGDSTATLIDIELIDLLLQ